MRSTSLAAERGKVFFKKFLIPVIEFICAVGGSFISFTGQVGKVHSALVLGVGVSPASNLTTNLPQSVVTSYDKVFVANLKGRHPGYDAPHGAPWTRTRATN